MKIALVITDGLEQFVLTPETDVERKLVDVLTDRDAHDILIKSGSFYECQGGYMRHGTGTDSAFIVLRPKRVEEFAALPEVEYKSTCMPHI